MKDDLGQDIQVGDILDCEYGYSVIVQRNKEDGENEY